MGGICSNFLPRFAGSVQGMAEAAASQKAALVARGPGAHKGVQAPRPPNRVIGVQMSGNKCSGQCNVNVNVNSAHPRIKINVGV